MWKIAAVVTLGWGGLTIGLGFAPEYSPVALLVGVVIMLLALAATLILGLGLCAKNSTVHWLMRVTGAMSLPLFGLCIGIRAWTWLVPEWFWWWVFLFGGMSLLAWAFPALYPRLSAWLFEEQMYPETPLGRGCLAVLWFLFPMGSSLGLYLPRYGLENVLWLIVGTLASMLAIGGGQAFAHQLWRQRPWAQGKLQGEGEAETLSEA